MRWQGKLYQFLGKHHTQYQNVFNHVQLMFPPHRQVAMVTAEWLSTCGSMLPRLFLLAAGKPCVHFAFLGLRWGMGWSEVGQWPSLTHVLDATLEVFLVHSQLVLPSISLTKCKPFPSENPMQVAWYSTLGFVDNVFHLSIWWASEQLAGCCYLFVLMLSWCWGLSLWISPEFDMIWSSCVIWFQKFNALWISKYCNLPTWGFPTRFSGSIFTAVV